MSKRVYRKWPKKTVERWFKLRQERKTYKQIGEKYNPPLLPHFIFTKIQQLHEGVL
jgi:hypothetical protein